MHKSSTPKHMEAMLIGDEDGLQRSLPGVCHVSWQDSVGLFKALASLLCMYQTSEEFCCSNVAVLLSQWCGISDPVIQFCCSSFSALVMQCCCLKKLSPKVSIKRWNRHWMEPLKHPHKRLTKPGGEISKRKSPTNMPQDKSK